MASDTDSVLMLHSGGIPSLEVGSTPEDVENIPFPSSQITLPSTEAPGSPMDAGTDVNISFKTEVNDDRIISPPAIPSSLTPPPSTQQPNHVGDIPATLPPIITNSASVSSSQATSLVSPPATVPAAIRRTPTLADEYMSPTPLQIQSASTEDLRDMLFRAVEEQIRLAKEVAGYRFRVAHLTMQEGELAERTIIELDATRCEVATLRDQLQKLERRQEADAAKPNVNADYTKLLAEHEQLKEENKHLVRKLKAAKKVIQEKDEANVALLDDKDALLTRLRENREHMQQLRSPGRILHQALTPRQPGPALSTPQQQQQPKSGIREPPRTAPPAKAIEYGQERISGGERFSALLSVLNQENTSAPSTPVLSQHASSRHPPKHTRNVQSLSSLPNAAPFGRPHGGLLPSVDLVPQSEPRRGLNPLRPTAPIAAPIPVPMQVPAAPIPVSRAPVKSRESTISAEEDNQELARQARQALQQVDGMIKAAEQQRRAARSDDVHESRASHEASQMLRRYPHESFEITRERREPEKTATGRTKLHSSKPGDKRKHEDDERPHVPEGRRGLPTSPKRTKLPDGLGIKYR